MLRKIFKSKTINFNVIVGAVFTILTKGFGMKVDPELINSILVLGNILLRFVTNESVWDKE